MQLGLIGPVPLTLSSDDSLNQPAYRIALRPRLPLEAKKMFGEKTIERNISVFRLGPLFAAFVLSVIALTAITTSAQVTGSATLRGTLKDPRGAVVPNASVRLINEATKAERKTQSNDDGQYVFTIRDNDTLDSCYSHSNAKSKVVSCYGWKRQK